MDWLGILPWWAWGALAVWLGPVPILWWWARRETVVERLRWTTGLSSLGWPIVVLAVLIYSGLDETN